MSITFGSRGASIWPRSRIVGEQPRPSEPLTPGGSLLINKLGGREGTTPLMNLERLAVEVTNRCAKACWFCYNHCQPAGATAWTADELVAFVTDCAAHGVKAVSFGGGEPLQYEAIFEVLERLH